MTPKKTGTETRSFGVSKRENHDSSIFYNQKVYSNIKKETKKIKYFENSIDSDIIW